MSRSRTAGAAARLVATDPKSAIAHAASQRRGFPTMAPAPPSASVPDMFCFDEQVAVTTIQTIPTMVRISVREFSTWPGSDELPR